MKLDTEALKRLMGNKFYDAATLAAKVGVSTQSIRMYAWGKTQPKADTMRKLCEALECKPDDIVKEW